MDEYLVKCWIRIKAYDSEQAKDLAECMLENCHVDGRLSDYKILSVIRADEVTALWEGS